MGSLLVGGWEWARRWILADVVTGLLIGVVTSLVLLAFGFGAASFLALLGLPVTLLVMWLVGTVTAVRWNANYAAKIQRLGPDIHFDLNLRGGRTWEPARGRCGVKDPNGVVLQSSLTPVGPTFWVRYPADFPGAPPITPGRYVARWEVERRPGSDKWRVLLTKGYSETVKQPPRAEPPAPGSGLEPDERGW